MGPLDPTRLRLSGSKVKLTAKASKKRVPRHRGGEWFLRGPIPGNWLTLAASLNVRALRVALAIWCEAGMRRASTVRLTLPMRERFSVARLGRGLSVLERAGLVKVKRRKGCLPEITILEGKPCTTN
jgi:hypothetical protein